VASVDGHRPAGFFCAIHFISNKGAGMTNADKIAEVSRIMQGIIRMSKGGNAELTISALVLLDSLAEQIEKWAADQSPVPFHNQNS
jgi:hypothetical protein